MFANGAPTVASALTSALVDGPGLLVQVVGIRLVEVEAFGGVGHRCAVLRLVREGRSVRQNGAGQVCLGAAVWVPLVRQLTRKTPTKDV